MVGSGAPVSRRPYTHVGVTRADLLLGLHVAEAHGMLPSHLARTDVSRWSPLMPRAGTARPVAALPAPAPAPAPEAAQPTAVAQTGAAHALLLLRAACMNACMRLPLPPRLCCALPTPRVQSQSQPSQLKICQHLALEVCTILYGRIAGRAVPAHACKWCDV
jgi:hypothetical protein